MANCTIPKLSEFELEMRLTNPPEDASDIVVQEMEASLWRWFLEDSIELRRIELEHPKPERGWLPNRLFTRFMYLGFIRMLFDMGMRITALELMEMVTKAIKDDLI